jgi:hypothetical protein
MNTRAILFASLLGLVTAHGQGTTTVPPETISVSVGGTVVEQTATIALGGPPPQTIVPMPAQPPITIIAGTKLKLTTAIPGTLASVQWYKNGQKIESTGLTLEIASATATHSGHYLALVKFSDGRELGSDVATVVVTSRQGQRLLNFSSRARVSPEQPFFLSGFVVEPGPTATLLLIRAVGPALAGFGVTGALATPQLRVVDAQGREIPASTLPFLFPPIADAARRVGAFDLPAGGKDVAQLYYLAAGAFVAQLSSADGGSGQALLEIYEVPL